MTTPTAAQWYAAQARIAELQAALAWAIEQIEDDLDPDHQAALERAHALAGDATSANEISTPRVVIEIEGGLVQNVTANCLLEVVKIDYDTEGCDDDDLSGVVLLDEDGNESITRAWRDRFNADIGLDWVNRAFMDDEVTA